MSLFHVKLYTFHFYLKNYILCKTGVSEGGEN